MSPDGFVVSHASDSGFERGLRTFFEYRELGHSDDIRLRETVMPADFGTEEVESVSE